MRFKTVCCVCRRVKSDNNEWKNIESFNPDTASHGYCEVCAAALLDRIADRQAMLHQENRMPA